MSEVKHTAGQWSCLRTAHPLGYIVTGRDGIYDIAIVRDVGGTPENAANARLIAAAPDGLDVAQAIEHALTEGFSGGAVLDENSPLRAALRAFIAKATGERP